MTRYLVSRVVGVPVTLLLVLTVVFALVRSSGSIVDVILPPEATTAQRAALAHELHLDEPAPIQIGDFLWGAAHGDFGRSLYYQRPALLVAMDRVPATLQLAAVAMGVSIVLALLLGTFAAIWEGSLFDLAIGAISVLGQSMPSFWIGLMLMILLAVNLHWLPTSGSGTPQQLVLPVITLAAFVIPQILMLTRSSMLDVLNDQFITVAKSKGLSPWVVVTRHALRNALNPVIASIGLQMGTLMGGAVITETIFAWPGIGRLTVEAVYNRDLPVVEACIVVLALGVLLSNLLADIVNSMLDPRVRFRRS